MQDIAQTQCFKDFSLFNYIYVDKTEQIYNLLRNRRVFVSRPRRFGKSLMLDTIGTLFEKGVEPYFKGTWIYDKWTEKKYPVLRLNFLKYSSEFEKFNQLFSKDIISFASDLNLGDMIIPEAPVDVVMFDLLKALNKHELNVVILIDEYDAQMTANIDNEKLYEKFRTSIREMYGVMKGDPCIRFLGVTGVTRLKDVSIFSVGSDIQDMSYGHSVSTITGFTREEIRKYYIDYLNLAVSTDKGIPQEQVTEEQREKLLDRLSEEYNGYCFDKLYKNKVYSTWSVNRFFQEIIENGTVIFGDYWYDNGGVPSILAKYLETHSINFDDYTADIDVDKNDFQNPTSLLNMKQPVLMCQTGYLTAHSRVPDGGSVTLGIPNMEVRRSLASLLSKRIFPGVDFSQSDNETFFSEASPEEIVEKLNSLMNTISYENYKSMNEKTVQGLLHAFFIGAAQPVRTEVQSASGRSDIVLEYENRRVVFELKYAENEAGCQAQLMDAVNQIRTRRYGDQLPEKDLLQIALVFNGDKAARQFTHYETVAK